MTLRYMIIHGLTVVAGIFCLTSVGKAQVADLNVSPKRLVLDQTSRAGAVYVFNRGARPATYADVRAGIEGVGYAIGAAPAGPAPGSSARVATVSLQLLRQGQSSLFGDVEIRNMVGGKPVVFRPQDAKPGEVLATAYLTVPS